MQERGYNQVYTGGLSSFSVVLMVAGQLRAEAQEHGKMASPARVGRLLLAIFNRFRHFNCKRQAVSMAKVKESLSHNVAARPLRYLAGIIIRVALKVSHA